MSDLKIIHVAESYVVVDKPSGVLSVPGKGPDKQDCITERVKKAFPGCPEHPSVHRLDMDTSGLLVVARTHAAQKHLSIQFQNRLPQKRYIALLDGVPSGSEGTLELPFRLDVENRPRQIYDEVHGKMGITHWKVLGIDDGRTRIEFRPVTGRTHQLRVHAAHEKGLGIPIVGDVLYGTGTQQAGELKLHACQIAFLDPDTEALVTYRSEPSF